MLNPKVMAAALLSLASAQQFVMYTPGGDDTSVERIDPILAPGVIGQHVHQVWGSNALEPKVTYQSLQSTTCTTVGDAAGRGNSQDNSIYWHPALYMEAKDGSGYIKVPTNGHKLYYQNAGSPNDKKRDPFEFPHGFRMLAGNPFMRAPAKYIQQQNITQWICHSTGPWNQGTAGGFPNNVTSCNAYPGFNGAIHFPHCWNGNSFNPAAPTAHMSYPIGDVSQGYCPQSHPIRLPHIFIENQFNVDAILPQVKPGTFVLAQGDNTGYGWHADFFNGWVDGAIPKLLATCPQGEWGNEDIGTCPSFKPSKVATSACDLPGFFPEKVDAPGKYLPGCNPIRDSNPAPIYETAPLGTYSNNCTLVGGGSEPAGQTTTKTTTTQHTSTATKTSTHTATTTAIVCPAAHRTKYTAPNGKVFRIQCNTDHFGGDMSSVSTDNLQDCAIACSKTSGCNDASFLDGVCYMKSGLGEPIRKPGVDGAKLISPEVAARDEEDFVQGKKLKGKNLLRRGHSRWWWTESI